MVKLKKLLKEPVIHFFVLGLVVFGLYRVLEKQPEAEVDPFLVEVSSADIEWFRTMWSKRMGREPTVEELRGQVHQLIREEVLSREKLAMGLDDGDMVVRRRLTQKMDFLFRDLSDIAEPSDSDLEEYLKRNPGAYEIPGELTFTQVYFNRDERGEVAAFGGMAPEPRPGCPAKGHRALHGCPGGRQPVRPCTGRSSRS